MLKRCDGVPAVTGALVVFLLAAWLSGCAGTVERAEDYGGQGEWMKAVLEYRKALARDPRDIELRSRLKQTELKAADYYYQQGMQFFEQDNLDRAILEFQQGLMAMSDHPKLQQAMAQAVARKEAGTLVLEARQQLAAGRKPEAIQILKRALNAYADDKEANRLLTSLEKQAEAENADRFALSSRAPITLNFQQTDLRTGFEFIAKSFGVDVIFDDGIKSAPVTLFAKDVTFEQALDLMLVTTKTFYKKIGPNTILVAPDTKEKRGQYEDELVRTFQLNVMRAKDMAEIIKGLITVKKMIMNETLNTLVLRDTAEVLNLAAKIIEANDRKPAELILDVELLEVNRSKAEKLGLDLGSYEVSAGVPPTTTLYLGQALGPQLKAAATLTLPNATFRFYKQDVDAKILANPKIRVLNGKLAKIHIGDRVPLRASTIIDATGQTRTTYDYKDIGIALIAEPTINLDNSTQVKLSLEVSALGQNLGTASEPALSIGTRKAETYMLLRDGETAILGGLIRDEDRNTRVRVPLLGDIPALGSLFTSYDNSGDRTDVLLTITPRVVRGWDLPDKKLRAFYSGTENNYQDTPIFAGLAHVQAAAGTVTDVSAKPNTPLSGGASAPPFPTLAAGLPAGATTLTFDKPVYEVTAAQEFGVQLFAQNLAGVANLPIEVLYNPQLLRFVHAAAGDLPGGTYKTDADAGKGVIAVQIGFPPDALPKGDGVLARLTMQGVAPGISYLVYRTPALTGPAGESIPAQIRASRVVIR
jgi:general secretion pathway protein D